MKTKLYLMTGCLVMLLTVFVTHVEAQSRHSYRFVPSYVVPAFPEVGDTISVKVKASSADTLAVNVYHDSTLVVTVPVTSGAAQLPSLAIGAYWYTVVNTDGDVVSRGGFLVRPPRVEARVTPSRSTVGDTVSIKVDAPSSETFTLTIYKDTTVLQTLSVSGGTTVLPSLPIGFYTYSLANSAGTVVARGAFSVNAPHVSAFVHPNFAKEGDTLTIRVLAPTTASFTLNIIQDSVVVHTLTVTGGSTQLPLLAAGSYSYELIDADGYVVNRGRIRVFVRNVHTSIFPNPSNPGEGTIVVDADSTETFTLNIYDSNTIVATQPVTGGVNTLPALPSGIYYYQVVNGSGQRVSRGRIIIY